jgi:hypothetical protein
MLNVGTVNLDQSKIFLSKVVVLGKFLSVLYVIFTFCYDVIIVL